MKVIGNPNLTDFTKNGECSCCGQCCSNYLPMTIWELRKLRAWVRKNNYSPIITEDALDVTCPFLDKETSRCVCYDERPKVCRVFTCRKAIAGEVRLTDGSIHPEYRVHNLRLEIFGDKKTLPYKDFCLLMEYIRTSPAKSVSAELADEGGSSDG